VFVAFLLLSSVGYYLIEGDYTFLDAVYMTVITVGTVGYHVVGGDELTNPGKVWTIFVIAGGLTSGAVAMSLVVAAVVEGQLRRIFGSRQLERKIAGLSGHVIVCGYGRMGKRIADSLQRAGLDVVVVDWDPERTRMAGLEHHLYVLGDAQDEAMLRRAGVERAGTFVAALKTDADNVFVTLTARGLNPEMRVIARARDTATENKLRRAGADRAVCPDVIGADWVVDVVVRPAMVDFVQMAQNGVELEMDQLTVPADSWMVGRTLRELALPARVGAIVAAVRRSDGQPVYNPGSDLKLQTGDTLILIGRRNIASLIQGLECPAAAEGNGDSG